MKMLHRNDGFPCASCGVSVEPRRASSAGPGGIRNHCPACLCSLHVDALLPGDRASTCEGVMRPVAQRTKHADRQILQRCERCGAEHWNVVAPDDAFEILLALPLPPAGHALRAKRRR